MFPKADQRICAIIAGGPSLNKTDVELVDSFAVCGDVYVIGINDAYRISNQLHMLYAADLPWWRGHMPAVRNYAHMRRVVGGVDLALWTAGDEAAKDFPELTLIDSEPAAEFFIRADNKIGRGAHGGFQALNIALNIGFAKILLLGYDCQITDANNRHWFGNHPQSIAKASPYKAWVDVFTKAQRTLYQWPETEVVNCSRQTALDCFRRSTVGGELL